MSYDAKGLVTRRETGTVTGTSDAAWSAFVVKQAVVFGYDAAGRVTSTVWRDGQVIAFVHDALGQA